jgi:hypothetical protein
MPVGSGTPFKIVPINPSSSGMPSSIFPNLGNGGFKVGGIGVGGNGYAGYYQPGGPAVVVNTQQQASTGGLFGKIGSTVLSLFG